MIVLATATAQSTISSRIGRFRTSEKKARIRVNTSRSARSARPPLAFSPRLSALARAYDVTAPITSAHSVTAAISVESPARELA